MSGIMPPLRSTGILKSGTYLLPYPMLLQTQSRWEMMGIFYDLNSFCKGPQECWRWQWGEGSRWHLTSTERDCSSYTNCYGNDAGSKPSFSKPAGFPGYLCSLWQRNSSGYPNQQWCSQPMALPSSVQTPNQSGRVSSFWMCPGLRDSGLSKQSSHNYIKSFWQDPSFSLLFLSCWNSMARPPWLIYMWGKDPSVFLEIGEMAERLMGPGLASMGR